MRVSAARASARLASIISGVGRLEALNKGAICYEDWSLASLGEIGRQVEWGALRPLAGERKLPRCCDPWPRNQAILIVVCRPALTYDRPARRSATARGL